MRILWVEDGGANLEAESVAEAMFQGILAEDAFDDYEAELDFQDAIPRLFAEDGRHEISVCRSFEDWQDISGSGALDFDVALLDINLEDFEVEEPPIQVADFARRAGLYIYHELREKHGMGAENIAFFSGEEDTMNDFKKACAAAMLHMPSNLFEKKDKDLKRVNEWLTDLAQSPYLRLRRAILDGCEHLSVTLSQVDESLLDDHFGLFRPYNPRLRYSREAYQERVERYVRQVRNALPSLEPIHAPARYRDIIQEMTSLWPAGTSYPAISLPEGGVSDADQYLSRSVQHILSLAGSWAAQDLLPDDLDASDAAYIALLAAQSWGTWPVKIHPFMRTLLDLLPAPEETGQLTSRLENETEKKLDQGFKTLVSQVRAFSGPRHPSDFMTACEFLTEEALEAGAKDFFRLRSQSQGLLHQAFWHALTPASVDPMLFFKVQAYGSGSLIEETGRRIYNKSFLQ